MKKRWRVISILAALSVVFIYFSILAQEPPKPPQLPQDQRMHMRDQLMKMRERFQLNLTDEQKEQIGKIMSQARKDGIRKRADLQVARIELGELLADKNVSDAAIKEKQEEILRLQNEQLRAALDTRLQIRQVMTGEQWEKAVKLRKFRGMRRMNHRFGEGMMQGPGAGRGPGMMMQQERRRMMPGQQHRGGPWFNQALPDDENMELFDNGMSWFSSPDDILTQEWNLVMEEEPIAPGMLEYDE